MDAYILAIVTVERDDHHRVYDLREPRQKEPDFGVTSVSYSLPELLARAEVPQ